MSKDKNILPHTVTVLHSAIMDEMSALYRSDHWRQ